MSIIDTILAIIIVLAIVGFVFTHFKWLLKLTIGLVLIYIVLSIIANPANLAALGWLAFSIICFVVGAAILLFIRRL